MRQQKLTLIIMTALAVVAVGVIVWLASAPAMPPVQKMEQAIPDDRIPR